MYVRVRAAGVDPTAGRARLGAVRGEGGRAAGPGAGRLQGPGAGARVQHLRADRVGARDLRAHHGAVPHGAAAAPQRHRTSAISLRDIVPGRVVAAAR